mmetsp:Transcript_45779/g.88046  ORF Transcript_45779/g.88046 Transcript_45779/m.88046 type:complete len:868 (-) Transcript_45779:31-2634(-)
MADTKISLYESCLKHLDELEQVIDENLPEVHMDLEELCSESAPTSNLAQSSMTHEQQQELAMDSLSLEERERCREIFDRYDVNCNGWVDTLELRNLLEEVHGHAVPDEEFTRMMWDYDANRDGKLQFEEFLVCFAFTESQKKAFFEERMRAELQEEEGMAIMEEREQRVRIDGVPIDIVTRYLQKELDEAAACWQLPQAFFIFMCFAISAMSHFKFNVLYAIDHAVTLDIQENANFAVSGIVPFENGRIGHKTVFDVNSIADFWSWFSEGLTPIFWPQNWTISETRANTAVHCSGPRDALASYGGWSPEMLADTPLVSPDTFVGDACPEQDAFAWPLPLKRFFGDVEGVDGNYLMFHSIVAGVRLRQERYDAIACDPQISKSLHAGKCKPDMLHYWLYPELTEAKHMNARHVNRPGGEDEFLLSRWNQSLVREHLRRLENRVWFSPETAKVEITFTTYNAHLDLVTVTYVFFFLNTAGHIHKRIEPVSFFLGPYTNPWNYVFDIVWLALVVKLSLEEGWELIKHWRQLGLIVGTTNYMTFVNFVDWISIVYSFVLVGLWNDQLRRLGDLEATMKKGQPMEIGTFPHNSIRQEFFDQVDDIVDQTRLFRNFLVAYPFVIVSRFFKAFASQPRLATVANTMVQASTDIFHFLVVVGIVFIIFTLSALLLWGEELEEFVSFSRASNTVFRIMLGDFDWSALHISGGRPTAYIWFWSFQWLVNLIMLNMLLAIVMSVYGDVKSHIGKSKTLWSQSYEIYRRYREVQRGHAMPLRRVLQRVDSRDSCREAVRLVSLVCSHGVAEHQALHILMEAHKFQEAEKMAEENLRDIKRIRRIDTKVTQMHRSLARSRRWTSSVEPSDVPMDAGNFNL